MRTIFYLGIQMQVINEDCLSVTLRRQGAESADADFVVMKDSARYRAMFPEVAPKKLSLTAVIEPTKQELEAIDKPICISKEGLFLSNANSEASKFIDSFILDTTDYESAEEALQGIENAIIQDKTGLKLYILATFAYQFLAGERFEVNYQSAETLAKAVEVYKNQKHGTYHRDLLQAYLMFIDDDTPLKIKEDEIKSICALIPRESAAECVMCFGGFAVCNRGDEDFIITPKQAQTLFNKLYSANSEQNSI